mgnify:FL=1
MKINEKEKCENCTCNNNDMLLDYEKEYQEMNLEQQKLDLLQNKIALYENIKQQDDFYNVDFIKEMIFGKKEVKKIFKKQIKE